MSDQGKANYEAYRKLAGRPGVSAAPLPEYGQLPMELAYAFDAGADAVEAWVANAPVDEDAPGSEPKPAKVIVVVEPRGEGSTVERYYTADEIDDHTDYGRLRIKRDGHRIASYNADAWLCAREDGALVPDTARHKLSLALDALRNIAAIVLEADDKRRIPVKIARDALEQIAELDL